MEHDWVEIENRWYRSDDFVCRRCGAQKRYEEFNIPCGTSSRTYYYTADGKKADSYPQCVERDVAKR